jgi:hypothetical protein
MAQGIEVTAYDKKTEIRMAFFAVPKLVADAARRIARVPASDPDLTGVYPLTPEQIAEIGAKAGVRLDPDKYDYCLEAASLPAAHHAHGGPPRTRKERARAQAARSRAAAD